MAFTVRLAAPPPRPRANNVPWLPIVNDREKVISLKEFKVSEIEKKVQLLLDASGAKIKPLKRRTVESTTEAARGIWSGLHVEETYKI